MVHMAKTVTANSMFGGMSLKSVIKQPVKSICRSRGKSNIGFDQIIKLFSKHKVNRTLSAHGRACRPVPPARLRHRPRWVFHHYHALENDLMHTQNQHITKLAPGACLTERLFGARCHRHRMSVLPSIFSSLS